MTTTIHNAIYDEITKGFRISWMASKKTWGQLEMELAFILGVSQRTVANYRNGTTTPSGEQMELISKFFADNSTATPSEN